MPSPMMKRLEAIEHRLRPDEDMPSCIRIARLDAEGNPAPILGWRENSTREPIEVFRQPNESDDDLADRALAAMQARPGRSPRSVVVMVQITDD
ncbi:hypothetical protein [Halomonas sp.]|uniref:hypothetical protein n=1 Tax=Halomonas sp. TaxID=1486246 RepID=UPI003F8F5FBC